MAKKRYTPEQIIRKLREAEIEFGRGKNVETVCRGLGISPQTYYRWRKVYGGMGVDQAKRLKALEKENIRLKRLAADQALRYPRKRVNLTCVVIPQLSDDALEPMAPVHQ